MKKWHKTSLDVDQYPSAKNLGDSNLALKKHNYAEMQTASLYR